MAVTINEVAKLVGVSTSTVSRAFTAPDQVRAETRDRVLQVSAELGYSPNPSARSLRAGATATLGMIVPNITNPFYPPIFKALQQRARTLGYTTLVADCDDRESAELEAVAAVANRVDGLLLWASWLSDERLAEIAAQTPLVLVNREVPGISTLRIDLTAGVRQAGELLHALGHRRCALIDASRPGFERDKLFAEIFRGLGLTVVELGPYDARFESGVHAADARGHRRRDGGAGAQRPGRARRASAVHRAGRAGADGREPGRHRRHAAGLGVHPRADQRAHRSGGTGREPPRSSCSRRSRARDPRQVVVGTRLVPRASLGRRRRQPLVESAVAPTIPDGQAGSNAAATRIRSISRTICLLLLRRHLLGVHAQQEVDGVGTGLSSMNVCASGTSVCGPQVSVVSGSAASISSGVGSGPGRSAAEARRRSLK